MQGGIQLSENYEKPDDIQPNLLIQENDAEVSQKDQDS